MVTMFRILTLVVLLCVAPFAAAQYPLEIVQLRHRSVQDVIPILQPLAAPGATLSGQGYQLFVRTSPANLAELRRALAAIDRTARRLQISVRFDNALDADRRNLGASGSIGTGGARIEVQADERSTHRTEERATGFEVMPRLSGDTVQLDVAPQRESGDHFERISTRVSARLGEWFEVGGAASAAARDQQGIASTGSTARTETRRVWLKVEALEN